MLERFTEEYVSGMRHFGAGSQQQRRLDVLGTSFAAAARTTVLLIHQPLIPAAEE